ncbi:MAG: alpha-hydroxy acid oxidase [Mycobacteriales bacterium]
MLRIEDLAARAAAMLPPATYDYYAAGSGSEQTLADNVAAWDRVRLRPYVLRDVSSVDTSTTLLGRPVPAPVLVAPTAFHRLAHPDGERASAAGAKAAGAPYVVSTRASLPLAEIAAAAGHWWFQVYVLRDRGRTADLVARAAAGGAAALVLTADTPVVGAKRSVRDDVVPAADFLANHPDLADRALAEEASDVTPADIDWLRSLTDLPVVVKGVLRGDDARTCVSAGAAAVVVSNHGGRQLDGAVASADALAEVVAAVGAEVEVYVDGGVRRGVDILRALALGARAVLIGRPVLWALAVGGADGVRAVLEDFAADLGHVMALAGTPTVPDVTADLLARPLT